MRNVPLLVSIIVVSGFFGSHVLFGATGITSIVYSAPDSGMGRHSRVASFVPVNGCVTGELSFVSSHRRQ
jgi:hypothetical protein